MAGSVRQIQRRRCALPIIMGADTFVFSARLSRRVLRGNILKTTSVSLTRRLAGVALAVVQAAAVRRGVAAVAPAAEVVEAVVEAEAKLLPYPRHQVRP